MLLNNFFEILEKKQGESDSSSIVVKIKFNRDHEIFNGHFPDNPVVPGVCLIQMIKEVTEDSLGRSLVLANAGNVKFLNMISPEENEVVFLEIVASGSEEISVKANILFEGKIFLKFQGVFKSKNP